MDVADHSSCSTLRLCLAGALQQGQADQGRPRVDKTHTRYHKARMRLPPYCVNPMLHSLVQTSRAPSRITARWVHG